MTIGSYQLIPFYLGRPGRSDLGGKVFHNFGANTQRFCAIFCEEIVVECHQQHCGGYIQSYDREARQR